MVRFAFHEAEGKIRGDNEGYQHGKEHGHAGADRYRPHIGAHQSADKTHRQNGGDNGKGGEHRRIADLVNRPDRGIERFHDRGGKVTMDILDDHDGVIDQNTDREDQGKERDTVQGVADQVEDQQGQGECNRNGYGRNRAGTPPHEQRDQDRYRDGCQEHMEEQLVVLLPGGFTIVAGNRYLHIGGDDFAFQRLDLFYQILRYPGRI